MSKYKYVLSKDNIADPIIRPVRVNRKHWSRFRKFWDWRTSRRKWQIFEDWIVWVDCLNCWVKIPGGFITDGASVPKVFTFFVTPTDVLFYASILHDFIYRFKYLITCGCNDKGLPDLNWKSTPGIKKLPADKLLYSFTVQVESMKMPGAVSAGILCVAGWPAWMYARYLNLQLKDKINPSFDDNALQGLIHGDSE